MTLKKMAPIHVVINDQEFEIHCRHEDQWPPTHAWLEKDFDFLRNTRRISDTKYQQLKVWEQICGLFEMDSEKCIHCTNAMSPNRKGRLIPLQEFIQNPARPPFAQARKSHNNR